MGEDRQRPHGAGVRIEPSWTSPREHRPRLAPLGLVSLASPRLTRGMFGFRIRQVS